MIFSAVSVICIAGFGLANKLTLPVTTCKRDSTDYSTCLLHAVQKAWLRFVPGLPEFDFPPLDPLFYEHGEHTFDTGVIHAELNITNLTLKGLKNNQLTNVRTHLADDVFRVEIDFNIPKLYMDGYSSIEGRLGPFTLKGKGKFNLTILDVRGTYDLMGHVSNDTWTVERFILYPSLKKLEIFFDDIFDITEINKLVVAFINEYWPSLYREVLPILSNVWEPWLIDIVNRFFTKVSFFELFP
ncbi:uncharacterized protein LOC109852161 [Pseudomyrmex gracilis]|uniref:uncharacterized protein LOC109852161 n=1 Tax=Pseudomyrmex gracilis TaxID=219809 RepID=UPI0009951722|nr:uncharacterized protein LOC109852161 [Pseudomyrmex gracilis]